MDCLNRRLSDRLRLLDEQGLRRRLVPIQPVEQCRIQVGQQVCLNLSGNDYLGLACNRDLLQAFYAQCEPAALLAQYGLGSGASRLMTGSHDQCRQLEENLAQLYRKDRALVFSSGHHLNIGVLPALARKGDVILADKLCHASLIDGMRLTAAKNIRYPHLDYDRLESLLRQYSATAAGENKVIFIVTESIFSMDGDCADLRALVRLKEDHGAVLYVDEAHAVGVRGRQGLGLAEEQGVAEQMELLVGTFGKAWAGQGAFLACSQTMYDFLVNAARSLIYTTALPPVSIAWLNFILPRISAMNAERQHLAVLAERLRSGLLAQGLSIGGSSQIVPVLIGEAGKAAVVAARLRQHGIWVHAVRPPTVPQGTARIRLSVNAAMRQEELDELPGCLAKAVQQ